jgi:CBS domain-containing protein
MTRDVACASEDASLDDLIQLMEKKHIKRLPVLREERVIGIVSRADVMRALAGRFSVKAPLCDTAITARIRSELDKEPWAPIATVDVAVHDGIVEMTGSIFDERQRQALRVIAENVPGVKAVKDHLIWIEPMSGMVLLSPEDDASTKAAS